MAKPKITTNKVNLGNKGRVKINRPKKGEVAPVFSSLFGDLPAEPTPDPLASLEYTGDPEVDAEGEISETLQAFLREKQERRDQYRLVVGTEFWFAVCFQSREQKEEFLEKAGLLDLGDKYLDGLKLAQRLGVDVEPVNLQAKPSRAMPKLLRKTPIIPIKEGGED